MATWIAGRAQLVVVVILTGLVAGAIVGACSSDDGVPKPPQAFIEATVSSGVALSPVCRDVSATRKSLEALVTSVLRFDQKGVESATSVARKNLDTLALSASTMGQLGQVNNLRADVTKFEELLNQQGTSWSSSSITTQIRWIEDDLSAIENTAGCPG